MKIDRTISSPVGFCRTLLQFTLFFPLVLLAGSLSAQTLPDLGNALGLSGASTTSAFHGAATADGGTNFGTAFEKSDNLVIEAEIVPEASYQGTSGKIYAIALIGDLIYTLFEASGWQIWDGTIPGLGGAISISSYDSVNSLSVAGITTLISGTDNTAVLLFLAYDTSANPTEFYYSGNPLVFTVNGLDQGAEALELFENQLATTVIQTKCIVCHVAGGLGRDTDLVFQRTNVASTQNNFEVFSSLLESRSDGASYILSKVNGGNHVGGIQLAAGSNDYNTLSEFLTLLGNSLSTPTAQQGNNDIFAGVTLESREETLRRAAIMLASRLPTDTETSSVRNGDDDELRTALRGLMQGDGFHQFLLEGTNDRLLISGVNGEIVESSWPNYPAYANAVHDLTVEAIDNNNGDLQPVYKFTQSVQRALKLSPGKLVAHIAENDLPYTDILTADYMMMNPSVNFALGGNATFNDETDLGEFQPGQIKGFYMYSESMTIIEDDILGVYVTDPGTNRLDYPHSGLLTSPGFLRRYPTTATNRNRARARWTFFHFLDIDIEKSSQRPTDPDALADTNNPTMNNPNCTACHETMDPVAGAFQNYNDKAFYRRDGLDALDDDYKYPEDGSTSIFQQGDTWYRDMRAPGLFDQVLADSKSESSLTELGKLIIAEPGFARATVKFWWPTVFGSKILLAPAVTEDNGYEAQLAAFEAQSSTIETLAQNFSVSFNLRDLLVEMMMTPWYSAETVDASDNETAHIYAEMGSEKLLTPERLQRKTLELTGFNWNSYVQPPQPIRTGFGDTYRLYYGGIDAFGVTKRSTEITPLMSTVAMTHALESSCPIVLKEFILADQDRKLFSGIDAYTTPLLEAKAEIEITSLDSNDWKVHSLSATVPAGEKLIKVDFTNPYCDWDGQQCLEQRNLYLDYFQIKAPGQSSFQTIEINSSTVTLTEGCYLDGDGTDAAFYDSCSVYLPLSLSKSGTLEIKIAVASQRGGDELAKANLSLSDAGDPYESQTANAVLIREKLVELHQILHGKTYGIDSVEITDAYTLFIDTWLEREATGAQTTLLSYPNGACDWSSDFNFMDGLGFTGETHRLNTEYNYLETNYEDISPFLDPLAIDPFHVKQSWTVVMAYLMTHYHYLYE